MPLRERYVWVCTNRRPEGNPKGSCAQKGSEELQVTLKGACKRAGLDARVRVIASGCLDMCEHGIAVAVMPDGAVLGGVTLGDVDAFVAGLATAGGVAVQPTLAPRVVTAATPAPPPPLVNLRKPSP